MFTKLFNFCNPYTGKRWWLAVEIGGVLTIILAFIVAAPCVDMFWDTRHSFGAGEVIGNMFDPQNPLRVVVYGRWIISGQQSNWLPLVALFALSIGGRIGELMIMLGDNYRRGLACKLVRPHWLFPIRVWVKADHQG